MISKIQQADIVDTVFQLLANHMSPFHKTTFLSTVEAKLMYEDIYTEEFNFLMGSQVSELVGYCRGKIIDQKSLLEDWDDYFEYQIKQTLTKTSKSVLNKVYLSIKNVLKGL